MRNAAYWIEKLGLQAYPKGGYFRQMYQAAEAIPAQALPRRFSGAHAFSTAIYFLLQGDQISPLHCLKADEIWHFYAGTSLTIHLFKPDGSYEVAVLGSDPDQGQAFQVVAPAACWFGATLNQRDSYALVGCTVAPGFEITDFESADQAQMTQLYPAHRALIMKLTG